MKRRIHFFSTLGIFAGLLYFASAVSAQTQPPAASNTQPPSTASQPTDDKHDNDVDFSERTTDARVRLAIKAEKKAYEEHVGRAKEAKQLADDLKAAYETNHGLSSQDQKKLERLEKLTRRIRNDVGGSESNGDAKDLPTSVVEAFESIAKMADELCDQVEKTPRRVVSAAIIDQANKLISVIQFLRDSRH